MDESSYKNNDYVVQQTPLSDDELFYRIVLKGQPIIARVSYTNGSAGHFVVINS